jgi:hypothetical protein
MDIDDLKTQYGEIIEIEYGGEKYYFRKPARQEYKRYYDKLLESVYDACCILIIDTCVHPKKEEIARVIEQDPTMPVKIVGRLTDFFGSQVSNVRKI